MPACQGALGTCHSPATGIADLTLQAQRMCACLLGAIARFLDDGFLAKLSQ
jgi:hypothetical protein